MIIEIPSVSERHKPTEQTSKEWLCRTIIVVAAIIVLIVVLVFRSPV